MAKQTFALILAVMATALFVSVNVLANFSLRGVRVDLTEESLFTLSSGSRNIAADVDEEIHLYYYFSTTVARQFQDVVDYERRVRDMIDEYVRSSDHKLVLEVIDPEPYSEAEERAVRDGIAGVQTMSGMLYFGLVGTNATGGRQLIPFFGDRSGGGISFTTKERFLEYDISRLLHSLAHPQKSTLGVLSALPLEGGSGNPVMNQGRLPRWKFLDELATFYEVRVLQPSIAELPEDLDVLIIVHPRDFSDTLQYAIDQFVLAGGKLVAFVDPHCEADFSATDPSNPGGQYGASKASDLNRLFEAWGFTATAHKVVGDYDHGVQVSVPARDGRSAVPVQYIAWMRLDEDGLSREDPITSLLENIFVVSSGSLRATDGATTTLTPLLQTSKNSMEIDVGRFLFQPDPQGLLDSFVSGDERLTIAARVSGPAVSAFPNGVPSEDAPAEGHLNASDGPINLIVVTDADMLADQWWLRENIIAGMNFGRTVTSNNCDFLVHSVENLTGGKDLISIRARGKFSRPFERVDEIEQNARRRFTDKEQELQRKMDAAVAEISELGQQRDQSDPDARQLYSTEQRERRARALETKVSVQRQLRDVRHDMDKDITDLGRNVKLLNIFAVPLLVSLFAIALGLVRMARRTH